MNPELKRDLMAALERSHRLGTIGGNLEEQLAHCASFSSVLEQIASDGVLENALDLGTGGGLPGIALACLWPDTRWVLVDMRAARIDELERSVLRLGLADRVEVRAIEAQRLAHEHEFRESMDVVVARSFGQPSLAAECASGFLKVGGAFVVSEPPPSGDHDEPRWDERGLASLGFAPPLVVSADDSGFAVIRKMAEAPPTIPRLPPRANRGWIVRE